MKKLFYVVMACMPMISIAYSVQDLEKAIKESKLKEIRVMLAENRLTEIDKTGLLDLAQNTVNYRQGVLKGLEIKPDRLGICQVATPMGDVFATLAYETMLFGFGFLALQMYSLLQIRTDHDFYSVKSFWDNGGDRAIKRFIIIAAVSSGLASYCFNSKIEELKKLYDDALAIKMLLYRAEVVGSV